MSTSTIPSAEEVRKALAPLNLKQLEALADASGVPSHTIYKIKRGETANPGVDTVGKFLPLIPKVLAATQLHQTAPTRPEAAARFGEKGDRRFAEGKGRGGR